MANRTTAANVKSVIETALDDSMIEDIIPMANRLVTTIVGSSTLDADTLTDIETWLTAHIIAMGKERQAESERIEDIWITYQGTFADGLKSTTYGQMVLLLDSTGNFGRAYKMKAKIQAIAQYPENYE